MYFRAFFYHDLMNKDPEKRKKIKGVIVEIGRNCNEHCWCENARECKYKSTYRYHNACVAIERFFHRLGWKKFHIPIYFQRHRSDLSGTTLCPFKMPRRQTCWDCTHSYGDGMCDCEERAELIRAGKLDETYEERSKPGCRDKCKFWSPVSWYDDYDRKTGETIRVKR